MAAVSRISCGFLTPTKETFLQIADMQSFEADAAGKFLSGAVQTGCNDAIVLFLSPCIHVHFLLPQIHDGAGYFWNTPRLRKCRNLVVISATRDNCAQREQCPRHGWPSVSAFDWGVSKRTSMECFTSISELLFLFDFCRGQTCE